MNASKKLKVFLIEDAPQIRAILTEVLQGTGHVDIVGYADKEADALHQLRLREWDLAIIDISLKEGNGVGVLAGLKKDQRPYGRRVVFSGDPSPILKKRIELLGADHFFDKTHDIDGLVEYVEEAATH